MFFRITFLICLITAFSLNANDSTAIDKKFPAIITISPYALAGLNLYTENWAGSDLGNFSWTAKLDMDLKKKFNTIVSNESSLKLSFGQTIMQNKDSVTNEKDWNKPVKSIDNIEFRSDFDFSIKSPVDPFVGAHLISQFSDKSTTKNLNGNPITISELLGFSYKTPEEEFITMNTRLSGGSRQNIDRNRNKDTVVLNDMGLQFETHIKAYHPSKIVTFNSDFYLFKALHRNIYENNDYKSPDLTWENGLKILASKIIVVDIFVQMLYDKEVLDKKGESTAARWKQNMSLGLTYTFTNKKEI